MADDVTRTFGGSEHGLPVEQALLLEQACDRFEARWRVGERPDLAAAIRDLPEAIHAAAIRELIQLDVFYRGRLGEIPVAADYAGDFPGFDPVWLCDVQTAEHCDGSSTHTAVSETARIIASTPLGRFGDYELLAVIAHGAMGVVYKARQIKLDRIVALKMIRSGEFADPGEIRRFRQEARDRDGPERAAPEHLRACRRLVADIRTFIAARGGQPSDVDDWVAVLAELGARTGATAAQPPLRHPCRL